MRITLYCVLYIILINYSNGTGPKITQHFNRNKNEFYINVSILKYVNGYCLDFILKVLKNEITFTFT